jgi:hypothetical protein
MRLVLVVVFIHYDTVYSGVMVLVNLFDSARSDDWGILLYNLPDLSVLLVEIIIDFLLLSHEQLLYFGDVVVKHLFKFVV